MASPDFPLPLVHLAQLLGEALGGPVAPSSVIDGAAVTLALRRHHVGPLLYAVATNGHHEIAPDLLLKLEWSYRASASRRETALARLHQIAEQFDCHAIEWMAIKGTTQAQQLYVDPAWRDSADIDILVPPDEFSRALDALIALGFTASNPPMPKPRIVRRLILNAVRDVTLIARDDHSCAVELHRRLFFAGGSAGPSLRSKIAPGSFPAPVVGPDLAFYLIAHGALSFWVRLKWLADLVPLFAKLSDGDRLAILEHARRARAESSVAASLLVLRELFPFVELGPLTRWLSEKQSEASVRRRFHLYAKMLSLDSDWKQSPLDNAFMALEANWLLFERPSTRAQIFASALPSSLARKIAGMLSRSDRALTRSDAPPEFS
jgi:hypothetical protein